MTRLQATIIVIALFTVMVSLTACEVVGYNTPVVTTSGAWKTVETIDPITGDKLLSIETNTRANSFFARILSLFGRPSLTVSCIQGGPDDKKTKITIDWREAVGPPNLNRTVYVRYDGGDVQQAAWETSVSGRESFNMSGRSYAAHMKDANIMAVRVVNSSGASVTLVFGLSGFDTTYDPIAKACS